MIAFIVSSIVYLVVAFYLRRWLEPYGLARGFNGLVIVGVLASLPAWLVSWLIDLVVR